MANLVLQLGYSSSGKRASATRMQVHTRPAGQTSEHTAADQARTIPGEFEHFISFQLACLVENAT